MNEPAREHGIGEPDGLSARASRLVGGLRSAFASRAAREAAASAALVKAREDAERDRRRVIERAEDERTRAIIAAEGAYAHERRWVDGEATASLDYSRNALESALRELDSRHEDRRAKINRELKDALWLAETMLDSDLAQLQENCRHAELALDGAIGEAQEIDRQGVKWLKQYGAGAAESPPTGEAVRVRVGTLEPEGESPDVIEFVKGRVAAARGELSALAAMKLPRAARGGLFWAGAVLVVAGSTLAALGWNGWAWSNGVAIAAGAALVVVVVLGVVLSRLAARNARARYAVITRELGLVRSAADSARGRLPELREAAHRAIREKHTAEEGEVRKEHRAALAEADAKRDTARAQLEQANRPTIARLEKARDERATKAEAARRDAVSAADEAHEAAVRGANDRCAAAIDAAVDEERRAFVEISAEWRDAMTALLAEAAALERRGGELRSPMDQRGGLIQGWTPMRERVHGARLGVWRLNLAELPGGMPADARLALSGAMSFALPVSVDVPGMGSLVVRAPAAEREAANGVLRAAMLRLLTAFPPGKCRFTIVDPVGLGQSFAGFMHLAEFGSSIVGERIWTEARQIERQLQELTEHMEKVIQKYLRDDYATIDEYNEQAGEIAEAYRFLVLADYPANISENTAARLASIAASGARCGVFILLAGDPTKPLAGATNAASWEVLERGALVLEHREGKFVAVDEMLGTLALELDPPMVAPAQSELFKLIGEAATSASWVQVPFGAITPSEEQWWGGDCADELVVPLGRTGATKRQYLSLGKGTAQHAVIAGRTGSGKSTLLHVIITSAAMWYSPQQVEMYLVDFKKGVEFKAYAARAIPHVRVVAVETDREFGLSVLKRIDAELNARGELFRGAGAQSLAQYRRATGKPMPRVLLVVDEFQELFVEDDRIAQESALLLDRVVRQGRAFGVHVILGSQTLGGAYSLNRATIGQMNVRIALQCSEADSYLILSEENAAARLLSRPGEAIYNDAGGLIEGNSPFQIVWLPEEQRDAALDAVAARARDARIEARRPIVFEGNAPVNFEETITERAESSGTRAGAAILGEPIAIKEPTAAVFRAQSGSNLLIVGQNEESARALLIAATASLAAGQPGARFIVLDSGMEAGSGAGSAGGFAALAGALGERLTVWSGLDIDSGVARAAEIQRERAAGGGAAGEPVYLVVHGLQRMRSLRRSESDFGFSLDGDSAAASPAKQFAEVLREGARGRVHVLVWCDTVTNLERALDRAVLREFDQRVLFQMSAADSTTLIDTPDAAKLGLHRAIYFSEERGEAERFRPCAMPSGGAIARLLEGAERAGVTERRA